MDIRPCIVIKGEIKTYQIKKIIPLNRRYCLVYFTNGSRYRYRKSSIIQLNKAIEIPLENTRINVKGKLRRDIARLWRFDLLGRSYWRIQWTNGAESEYHTNELCYQSSILNNKESNNKFEYFRHIAEVNTLGTDNKEEKEGEEGVKKEAPEGFLSKVYKHIQFISPETALSVYLQNSPIAEYRAEGLIFPFGCNASQIQAVQSAFSHQVSIIQGPPGTGKTQTILNILANILLRGQTALVVSNNNSATRNIQDKLRNCGLSFLVAPLGNQSNKAQFIQEQAPRSEHLCSWAKHYEEQAKNLQNISVYLKQLKQIFLWQEALAKYKSEYNELQTEWGHFALQYPEYSRATSPLSTKSQSILSWWRLVEQWADTNDSTQQALLDKLSFWLKWKWNNRRIRKHLAIKKRLRKAESQHYILSLQTLYYRTRLEELERLISDSEQKIKASGQKELSVQLAEQSLQCLQGALYHKYSKLEAPRTIYQRTEDLWKYTEEIIQEYPIVLSSTYSAKTSLEPEHIYDYVIMDEASQISIETGVLALSCARRAVIVGDNLQLSNVQKSEEKQLLHNIFEQYDIDEAYNSATYNFLSSACKLLPQAPQTLLREHYRCHPKIINYCNQRFYSGQLIIMTEEDNKSDTMVFIETVKGNHRLSDKRCNPREIEAIRQEALPLLQSEEIGIISPYRDQALALHATFPQLECDTVHKFQGREKDCIIVSTVDDRISDFSDSAELINVAVSRAKTQFVLISSGNEQELQGNISDLIGYIRYNNFQVYQSQVCSVFDYLYSQYTAERLTYLRREAHISDYASENLGYALICEVLGSQPAFASLKTLCHFPLSYLIRDYSLLNEEEKAYAQHRHTHLDFLVINKLSKQAVLAIEVDGYRYHKEGEHQAERDKLKNRICQTYGLPLLRLSTKGCNEREQITQALEQALGIK